MPTYAVLDIEELISNLDFWIERSLHEGNGEAASAYERAKKILLRDVNVGYTSADDQRPAGVIVKLIRGENE